MPDNVFEKVGHGIEVAAKDVAHVVVAPISFIVKTEKVIASAIKYDTSLRAEIISLITSAEKVVGDLSTVVSEKGFNLAHDSQALADAEAFFLEFKNKFIPLVEEAYSELKDDVQ